MMSESEKTCCSGGEQNSTTNYITLEEVGGLVKPKEIIILCIMFSLLIVSIARFFKHWKKNYYDNANHLPSFYGKDASLTPSPIREFPLVKTNFCTDSSAPFSRRNTVRSEPTDWVSVQRRGFRMNRTQSVITPRTKIPPLGRMGPGHRFRRQYSDRVTTRTRYNISNSLPSEDSCTVSFDHENLNLLNNVMGAPSMPQAEMNTATRTSNIHVVQEEPEDRDSDSKSRSEQSDLVAVVSSGGARPKNVLRVQATVESCPESLKPSAMKTLSNDKTKFIVDSESPSKRMRRGSSL